jgi:GntR family transcriptional repressor for pyruvate dehydrogenase complex
MSDARSPFRRIPTGRSFELVIQELRKAVVRGLLSPGEKLPSEPELAGQFGVSRSVLREALKVMELAGELEVRRGYGGGTFVATPAVAEEFTIVPPPPVPTLAVTPAQLHDTRLAIEPHAAAAAAKGRVEDVLAVHEAIRHMEVFDEHPAHVLAAAVDFHVAVARASRNPVFVSVLQSLRPVMYLAMNPLVVLPGWVEQCREQHEQVLKEIEGGDESRASDAMRAHLVWKGESRA